MKDGIIKKLIISLLISIILSVYVFFILIQYNSRVTDRATTDLGAIYMEEMMLLMKDHFLSIVDVKTKEAKHIAKWTPKNDEYRSTLSTAAQSMDFEYVTLYDSNGNYESILGEPAWYRDFDSFSEKILSGEDAITTGYLTDTGEKYIVFGTPAQFEMKNGNTSSIMLAGFSVEKLYEYINLDAVEPLGSNVSMWIVLTNGSYILKATPTEESSLFERLNNWGTFVGIETSEALSQIEKAMASGNNFSYTVSVDGEAKHIYGSPASGPIDWYFMITMPQGISDAIVFKQNSTIATAYIIAGMIILLIFGGVFFIHLKISLRQRNELEIAWKDAENSKATAETANMAKSLFLSNMSHDIRTPMNAIIGFTNLALKEFDVDAIHAYLGKISVSGNHLLLLINEILEMSRIESGKIVLNEMPCNLSDLLEDLQTVIGKKAEEKNQKLLISGNIQDNYVYSDKRRLSQILINLTDNAIKYADEHGDISVTLNQKPCDDADFGCFEIIVSDNGIGMSEEFAKKVFEPFERESTSTVSGIEGTGLGLSIVKHFVDMIGGNIRVDTKQGEGSVFTVDLKLKLVEPEIVEKMKSLQSNGNPDDDFSEETAFKLFAGKHILLVEDNIFNLEITQSILEQAGFIVDSAENGAVALDKIKQTAPDYYSAVLMDVQMPVMNGYEATHAIRSLDNERSKICIIAVTANAFDSDRENVLAAGMNDYITKPIKINELYKMLKKHTSI